MDDRKPIEQWIYHREPAPAATSIVAAEVESLAKTQRITEKRNDRQSEWRLILLGVLARERKLIYFQGLNCVKARTAAFHICSVIASPERLDRSWR